MFLKLDFDLFWSLLEAMGKQGFLLDNPTVGKALFEYLESFGENYEVFIKQLHLDWFALPLDEVCNEFEIDAHNVYSAANMLSERGYCALCVPDCNVLILAK